MSRPAPPTKTWAQLVASTPPNDDKPADQPKQAAAGTIAAPQPKVQPKPASPLPATNSTKSVQPCFATLAERKYPLGFDSLESFEQCMQSLCEAAQDQGMACSMVGVRGSAATYASSNPHKKGQHFDSRGKGKSDIDAFIVSDSKLDCRPNKTGFFHPDKVAQSYPALAQWGEDWSEELGREITPAVQKSSSPALKEPYIAYACDC